MPTVTVIIPVYKVERYLDACVESVVRQSYADLEILLVDDGSPDRLPGALRCLGRKGPAHQGHPPGERRPVRRAQLRHRRRHGRVSAVR